MGRHNQPRSIVHDVAGDQQVARNTLRRDQRLAVGDLLNRRLPRRGRSRQDLRQVVGRWELDFELEQESVQLRLRQRIGAGHLDRVLGGDHEERPRQRVTARADGNRALLHRLEHGRLRLRRRTVDFVDQDQIGEHRTRLKLEAPLAGIACHQQIRPQNVGRHQVGRALNPAVREIQHVRECPHQERLAQSWRAFEQGMPARQQRDEHTPQDVRVADDDLRELALDRNRLGLQPLRIGATDGHRGPVKTTERPNKARRVAGLSRRTATSKTKQTRARIANTAQIGSQREASAVRVASNSSPPLGSRSNPPVSLAMRRRTASLATKLVVSTTAGTTKPLDSVRPPLRGSADSATSSSYTPGVSATTVATYSPAATWRNGTCDDEPPGHETVNVSCWRSPNLPSWMSAPVACASLPFATASS